MAKKSSGEIVKCKICDYEGTEQQVRMHTMAKHEKKKRVKHKLPTIEDVKFIQEEWQNYDVDGFSKKLKLDETIIKKTAKLLRKLESVPEGKTVNAGLCPRKNNLKDIIRGYGATLNMVLID